MCFRDLWGGLKIFFPVGKWPATVFCVGICVGILGCVKQVSAPVTRAPEEASVPTGIPETDFERMSPRAQASLRLTEQGRKLLENGRSDAAIRMLEQAINLDVANGLSYFYMSEAWILKGNLEQATEFNRLAQIYLKESPEWMTRVLAQKDRIERLSR